MLVVARSTVLLTQEILVLCTQQKSHFSYNAEVANWKLFQSNVPVQFKGQELQNVL